MNRDNNGMSQIFFCYLQQFQESDNKKYKEYKD